MASSSIKNLQDLQNKKSELKNNIEKGINNPLGGVGSFLSTILNKNGNKFTNGMQRNKFMDEGVKAVLTLASSTLASRLKLGALPKMVLTGAVAIATPYVVDYIQKKISNRK